MLFEYLCLQASPRFCQGVALLSVEPQVLHGDADRQNKDASAVFTELSTYRRVGREKMYQIERMYFLLLYRGYWQ